MRYTGYETEPADAKAASFKVPDGVIYAGLTLLVVMLTIPGLIAMIRGRARTRERLRAVWDNDEIGAAYAKAYPEAVQREEFDDVYGRRSSFVVAILLLLAAAIPGIVVGASLLTSQPRDPFADRTIFESRVLGGTAGAFVWLGYEQLKHTRSALENYLSPAEIREYAIRILVSVPMAVAFSLPLDGELSVFVAFATAAFSIGALQTMARVVLARAHGIQHEKANISSSLDGLLGTSPAVLEAYLRAGLRSVEDLSCCDPVRGSIVLREELDVLAVRVSRAQLYALLPDKLGPLSCLGVVGIHDLVELAERAKTAPSYATAARVEELSRALGTSVSAAADVLDEIAGRARPRFLRQLLRVQGLSSRRPKTVLLATSLEDVPRLDNCASCESSASARESAATSSGLTLAGAPSGANATC